MKRILPITTIVISGTSLVSAADMPLPWVVPAAVVGDPWTGLHVGASFGYVSLNDRVTHTDGGFGCWWSCDLLQNLKDTSHGAIGGIQVGYDWRQQSFVLGFEADISAASNSGSHSFC